MRRTKAGNAANRRSPPCVDTAAVSGTVLAQVNSSLQRSEAFPGTASGLPIEEGSLSSTTQRRRTLSDHRLTRRGAVRAGGLSAVALLGSSAMQHTSAQNATPMAGQE